MNVYYRLILERQGSRNDPDVPTTISYRKLFEITGSPDDIKLFINALTEFLSLLPTEMESECF